MTLAELESAKAGSLAEIAGADAASAETLRVKYIGRNGIIPALIKAMKDVPREERPAFGKAVQAWKAEVEAALSSKGTSSAGGGAVDAEIPRRRLSAVRLMPDADARVLFGVTVADASGVVGAAVVDKYYFVAEVIGKHHLFYPGCKLGQ